MSTSNRIARRAHELSPRIFVVATLMLFLLASGCLLEPDRNNPSDPSSPEYNDNGVLTFAIYDRDNNPLENAIVHLLGFDEAQFTDEEGISVFEVPGDTVYFTVEREGYVSKSDQVFVKARDNTLELIRLNGEPFIDSVRVTTTMIEDQITPLTFHYGYQCRIYAGDFDTVDDLKELKYYIPGAASAESVIAEEEMFIEDEIGSVSQDLVDLIGEEFRFVLYDEVQDTAEVKVILNTHLYYTDLSEYMEPIGPHEYVIGDMDFTWSNRTYYSLLYTPNKYQLKVFEQEFGGEAFVDTTVVFDFDAAQEATDFTINITQADGFIDGQNHYWQLTMYDLNGNFVTSRRLEFTPSSDIIGD